MREQSLEGIIKMSLALNVQKTHEDERRRKRRRIIIGTWTQIELADSLFLLVADRWFSETHRAEMLCC